MLLLLLLVRDRGQGRLAVGTGADADRPALKPWYRLATCDAGVIARFGPSSLLFEGAAAHALLPALLPLLDGTRTLDELAIALGPHTRPAIQHALAQLDAHDLLRHAPAATTPTEELLEATTWQPRPLSATSASVLGDGTLARELRRLLRRAGFDGVGDGWDGELVVGAPGDEAEQQLREWNETALGLGRPWLAVSPFDGSIAAVGPLVVPGETACYACYLARRHVDPYAPSERPVRSRHLSSPALDALLAGLAALVAVTWLATGDTPALGGILAFELETLLVTRHRVYRAPRCPSCASVAAALTPWGDGRAVAA